MTTREWKLSLAKKAGASVVKATIKARNANGRVVTLKRDIVTSKKGALAEAIELTLMQNGHADWTVQGETTNCCALGEVASLLEFMGH